jgi:cytochrome b561
MAARNGPDSFGWVSRALHWAMALAILFMFGFGFTLAHTAPTLNNFWLFGLHKSIGLTLFMLAIARLVWHRVSPPPPSYTEGITPWQQAAAHAVHRALYVLILLVPVSGWAAASATGIDTVYFGLVTVPPIAPATEAADHALFLAHGFLNLTLALCVALHAGAALHRHFVHRDATLARMLGR